MHAPKGSSVCDLVTQLKMKLLSAIDSDHSFPIRLSTIKSIPQPVMCGALGVSYMRYGVLDMSCLKATPTQM